MITILIDRSYSYNKRFIQCYGEGTSMDQCRSLPASGYTLQVTTIAKRFFRPSQHVARLVNRNGRICKAWMLSAPSWQLKSQVEMLRDDIEEMLGSRAELPVSYTELPPPRNGGTRQRVFAFAL